LAAGEDIGRITPTGTITELPIPTANSGPAGIAAGADGNLWFTEASGDKIGLVGG
jgi:virginiamycin B lyase